MLGSDGLLDSGQPLHLCETPLILSNFSIEHVIIVLICLDLCLVEGSERDHVDVEDELGTALLLMALHQDKSLVHWPIDLRCRENVAD